MGPRACETVASEWLSVPEAAAELGISARQAYRWVDKGWLPSYRFGHIRVKRADVERLIAEGLPA